MNRQRFILLVLLILTGCGGNSVTKPTVFLDAETYTNMGMQAFVEGDLGQAKWSFNRALSLYQGIDDQLGVLSSHINLAEVALSLQDSVTVNNNLSRASDIANISLQQYQTRITLLYALNALQQKQIPLAKSLLQSLLPEFDKKSLVSIPDIIQMTAIANRTKIAFIQNQNEILWTQRYANGLKLLADNNYGLEARLLRFQSLLLQREGKNEESESNLQQALSKYKKNIFRPGIAETLFELGKLYITEDRWQDAHHYLNRSINIFRYLGNNAKVTEIKEKLVNVEMKLGNLERRRALKQEQ
jgi:tetratricopeptide (TPR) repeat protein